MEEIKRYRISKARYEVIQTLDRDELFLLYTRHLPGTILNLLVDGVEINLYCKVVNKHDRYYKYCQIVDLKK